MKIMKMKKSNHKAKRIPIKYISKQEFDALSEEERVGFAPIDPKYEKVPLIYKIFLYLAAVCLVIYFTAMAFPKFADFFNQYIGVWFRYLLAKLTNMLPFSLAEIMLLLSPILIALLICCFFKHRSKTPKATRISAVCMLSVISLFFSTFVLCLATGYQGTSLEQKLGLNAQELAPKDLYASSDYLLEMTNNLVPEIDFGEDGFSKMPYNHSDMNKKLLDAYDIFCKDHKFISNFRTRLKPVLISEAMSYAHITGIYSYFTGEANLNMNFPDYTIPYTAAHEMAHQRGISREDEANMIAFLVCIGSDDPYIQYSGYLNMYEYVSSALYKADKKLYREVRAKQLPQVRNEQIAYGKFFEKYADSVASQVSGTVNDVYLMSQGTQGKKSYGLVVDLTVAYLRKSNLIFS